jgi:hypothetical protein
MAQTRHTHSLTSLEEALSVLLCLIDDAYQLLNPNCHSHESLKKRSDSEVLDPGSPAAAARRRVLAILPGRR